MAKINKTEYKPGDLAQLNKHVADKVFQFTKPNGNPIKPYEYCSAHPGDYVLILGKRKGQGASDGFVVLYKDHIGVVSPEFLEI